MTLGQNLWWIVGQLGGPVGIAAFVWTVVQHFTKASNGDVATAVKEG